MIREKIVQGDLLYHPVHGTCRVNQVRKQKLSGKQTLSYSLVPNMANHMKIRFVIAAVDMEISGFHAFVSLKEANQILGYLKAGDKTNTLSTISPKTTLSFSEQKQTWDLARAILCFSREKFEAKDQRKRQLLKRSAEGLVGELSFVFKITLKETAEKIRKSLSHTPNINPLVLLALTQAGGDD